MDILKTIISPIFFQCAQRCPIEQTVFIFGKMFYYFFNIHKKLSCSNSLFLTKKCTDGVTNFNCKALLKSQAFFILPKKSLIVFNRAPSDTIKVFFSVKISNYFLMSTKRMFQINSRFIFKKYTDVVKEIYFFPL